MLLNFPILDFYPASISYSGRAKSLVASEKSTGVTDMNRDLYKDTPFIYEIEYKNLTSTQAKKITDFFDTVRMNKPFMFFVQYKPVIVNFVSHIKKSQELYQRYNISFTIENFYGDTETYTSTNYLQDVVNSELLAFNNFSSTFHAIKNAETESNRVNSCYWDIDLINDTYKLEIELFVYSGQTPWICTNVYNMPSLQQNYTIYPQKLRVGYNAISFLYESNENYIVLYTEPSETSRFSLNAGLLRT